jgi:hypothetical protein
MDYNKLKEKTLIEKIIELLPYVVPFVIIVSAVVYFYNMYNKNNTTNTNNTNNTNNINNTTPQVMNLPDNVPKTVINGEYYDYKSLDINPIITILPAKVYNTITEVKGAVVSKTLANDDYKNVVFTGSDKATIITEDMIPEINTNHTPKQTIEFVWTDVNSGKCYVPELFHKDNYLITLGECSGDNAKYQWEDGFIKHINTNKYLQTWNNNDYPAENEGILLTNMENYQRAEKRQFDFIQSGNNLTSAKIVHRPSEKCILPKVGTNGKVLLSVKKC